MRGETPLSSRYSLDGARYGFSAAEKNKAVGAVWTPTALPAPDIKLAHAIRRVPLCHGTARADVI